MQANEKHSSLSFKIRNNIFYNIELQISPSPWLKRFFLDEERKREREEERKREREKERKREREKERVKIRRKTLNQNISNQRPGPQP